MRRAGGQGYIINKRIQIAWRKQAPQWGNAHGRPVGHAVVFQFSNGLAVTNGVQRNFRRWAKNVLIKGVKAQRPVQNVTANQVRVDLPVALQQRIRQTQRHRRIVSKFSAVKIAGRVIFRRAGQKAINPAKMRFYARSGP